MNQIQYHQSPAWVSESNRLLWAAISLIYLLVDIRNKKAGSDIQLIKSKIIKEIKAFEKKLTSIGYTFTLIQSARYCLCAAIDEAVLTQDWTDKSVWMNQSLISLFHQETYGGENFYIILENLAENFQKNIEFMELAYYLLSLGFEGKFYGPYKNSREEIRNQLFYKIRSLYKLPNKKISNFNADLSSLDLIKKQHKHFKKFYCVIFSMFFTVILIFNILSVHYFTSTGQQLKKFGSITPLVSFNQALAQDNITRRILK